MAMFYGFRMDFDHIFDDFEGSLVEFGRPRTRSMPPALPHDLPKLREEVFHHPRAVSRAKIQAKRDRNGLKNATKIGSKRPAQLVPIAHVHALEAAELPRLHVRGGRQLVAVVVDARKADHAAQRLVVLHQHDRVLEPRGYRLLKALIMLLVCLS